MKTPACLAAVAAVLTLTAAAHAQTVSPVPAPTIITSAPYTISSPGYYQLGANLTVTNTTGNIITITSGNVTLDFGGHYISGPSNAGATLIGVYAYEKGNLNILNGTVAYCYQGIDLEGNGQASSLNINQRVSNMLVSHCFYRGVDFNNASNCEVSGCRVSAIGGSTVNPNCEGIYSFVDGAKVSNNQITGVTAGTGGNAYAILASTTTSSIGNIINDCQYGIAYGICQANLLNNFGTAYVSVTDAGLNSPTP